ncbi:MAG: ATPase [Candidatus Accumulibacter phosphatis]|uniref:ATPase n=1 Tax=Candidatus Accumulibacter phosphatis TaxID=327160 RepID=A0A6A7RNE3_9PROT|nr:ATPase [Candidatus Accumulibacter phosphatis]
MAILEGIQIQNYRALKDVTLGRTLYDRKQDALPRLLTVIGANGSGKSSLLDALGFLGECLAEGVEAACDKPHRGGFERMRTQGSTEPIKFEVRYKETPAARPMSYSLHIACDAQGRTQVVYERLRQRRKEQTHGQPYSFLELNNGQGYAWSGREGFEPGTGTGKGAPAATEGAERVPIRMKDRQVLGIATLGTLASHDRIVAFRDFLSGWYLSYFVPELARKPSQAGADPHLDRRGENLARYLQYVQRENPQAFRQMLARIAEKVPGITDIQPKPERDRRLVLEFSAKGFPAPFYQQDMSDGTLKMLAYLLLMEDPSPAPLIGIEEPENGLHHQLLATLAQEFKEYASKARGPQILITTHAPNFVDALTPDEVWILDKGSDGFSHVTRAADVPGVREMFAEGIPMGSLWYSNHFGLGNP